MKHDDYMIGWICALATEMAVARAMLDERHDGLPQDRRDHNNYALGRIGPHNIVIACLPEGVMGVISAARVAVQMSSTFRSLRFSLLVGIGGGVPSAENDIRLGDVIVSKPTGSSGGVIQYDYGKTIANGRFEGMGSLNRPPDELLQAVLSLKAAHMIEEPVFPRYLSEMGSKYPRLYTACTAPSSQDDQLFEPDYNHVVGEATCVRCDTDRLVNRTTRTDNIPKIHYGLIASGSQVMKDGVTRERLRQELHVICFEMEAAGIMDNFPCLVIRGICDYADTHKNKQWQAYAAASAAAYAKELLNTISRTQGLEIRTVNEATTVAGESIFSTSSISRKHNRRSLAIGCIGMRSGVGEMVIMAQPVSECGRLLLAPKLRNCT